MGELSNFELDPSALALLVVDMQNDFCAPNGFFDRAGHDVSSCALAVERTAALLGRLRPLGVPIFWTRSVNPEPPVYKLPPLRFRTPRESTAFELSVGGTNCFLPGAWGTQIAAGLDVGPDDHVIDKARYNAFHGTDLERMLRERGIESLAVAGLITNCCVESTSRDAFMRDFGVLVLSDCVAAFRNEWDLHEASLRNLELFFAVVAGSDELVHELEAKAAARSAV